MVPAGSERSGFVFTHLDLGNKQVRVSLTDHTGAWHERRYTFIVDAPGLKADWRKLDGAPITNGMRVIECDDLRLRAELEKLPRAVRAVPRCSGRGGR